MKAVVFRGVGDVRVEDVSEPKIQEPTDAIVRVTAAAICGTDLHMIRGSLPGMKPGTVLGHEAVGVVEELGARVRNFQVGDRVVIPSTIACGYCAYCRSGYFAQCDNANPNGRQAGTAFFGGPKMTGPFAGLQAERARIPFANVGMVKIPKHVSDDQALLISDIFPTGWFGAKLAEIKDGDTVAVFGCGPVGQFAIVSALLQGASRVLAVDKVPSRLQMAQDQGAEVIDFEREHPVEMIQDLTGGIGVDRAIDAVGVDADMAHRGPASRLSRDQQAMFEEEVDEIAPQRNPHNGHWRPGDAPSQALQWAVDALCKAGTLSVVGVYPQSDRFFPIGMAMNKNLTINAGNCNHRKYIPKLLNMVASGIVDPTEVLTQDQPLTSAVEAYEAFDEHQAGWIKVKLEPAL